ncbi:head maturation protease, ClpP-related [Chromobacterium sp. TRC.1.1.SA]|uniref:Head maturation protease, ClpP-related n=2 Tax=Chromobacterium indicum TaxID=3110228 RepID=A0ABV0CF26_9NEIS
MPMQKLLIRPKNRTGPTKIRAETAGSEATLWLYDALDDWWGINAGDFCKEVAALTAETIHLRINSPGGDVFGARAIVAALRGSGAKVIAHVDGLAASAVTFIAVNCHEIRMADGAFFMIHQAGTGTWGNASDLRETADLLDKVDSTIVADYVRKTGQDEQQVRAWMAAETWFTAEEAKGAGLVDAIVTGQSVDNSAWDFSGCRNAPQALMAAPVRNEVVPEVAAPPDGAEQREHARRVLDLISLSR